MGPCGRGEGTTSRFARRWRGSSTRDAQARAGPAPGSGSIARGWVGANPAPGGARPGSDPHGYDPLPRPPLPPTDRTRGLGRRENRQPFDLLRPIPTKGRTRRIRPRRGACAEPQEPARGRPGGTPGRAPGPHPLPSPKRPAQPTGRRHTPRQNPMKAAVFGLGPRRDDVALSDPRHPGSSGTAHPSKSRANVRPV
jgi:hypothetical protein